ncbi:type VI secretion system tip protein TssI/VgrG, partial [Zooshikella harenae]
MIKPEYVIHSFNLGEKLTVNKVTLRDYNYTKPNLDLEQQTQLSTEAQRELYYHSGLYQTLSTGTHQANVKLLQAQSQITLGHGESNCIYLLPGGLFTLQEHTNPQLNQQYLITKARHHGKQPQSLEEGASDEPTTYNCHFNCTRFEDLEYKSIASPKVIKKNRCYSVESAIVAGPKGEEIYTDQYGRIKVQFHWDRDGHYSEHASCWVRVVQPWTGSGWGALQLPRIGQEVLVSFINSDPDRPIIKGGFYNGLNMPPYQLPEHKTKTTIKTCSTPNAEGFNEWRYEDKKGQEQIFVHVERNIDVHVNHNKTTYIGNQQHEIVDQSHHSHIHQNFTQHIHGQLNTKVEQQQYVTVHGNLHEKSKQKTFTDSTQEIHLQSSSKLIIDAGMELIAKGNNSFFKLNPGGVTMNGPSIRINAGGTPGIGTPAQSVALKSMAWDVDAQIVNVKKATAVADIQCDLCKKNNT